MTLGESQSETGHQWWRGLPLALSIIALVTVAAVLLSGILSLANLAFLFLLPVIAVSGRHGLLPGLLTATFSAVAFNFFLVPPLHTLHIADADNLVTFAILLVVALAVSHFAARLQAQASAARQKANESEALARFTMRLGEQSDDAAMRECLAETLKSETDCTVIVGDSDVAIKELHSSSPLDLSAARWALAHGDMAGRGAATMGSADSLFLSAKTGEERALLVQFWRGDALAPVSPPQFPFVQMLSDRCGEAIERLHVANARRMLDARERHDAMRDALLASFGHDMRTPLTTIKSGLDGLAADPADASALAAAHGGAARLEWLFTNLVDLARIRAGAVSLKLEAVDVTEAVASALDALSRQTAKREIALHIPQAMPLVRTDARLLHHILVNLIDNACKHTPANGALEIAAGHDDTGLTLSVRDSGPGLGSVDGRHLFAAFERGENGDKMPGAGLGLAIVAGFAKALEIAVTGANRAGGIGAEFVLRFPAAMVMIESAEGEQ
jgi:two-component system, OmpR family, sensor histidine kinase KdpD